MSSFKRTERSPIFQTGARTIFLSPALTDFLVLRDRWWWGEVCRGAAPTGGAAAISELAIRASLHDTPLSVIDHEFALPVMSTALLTVKDPQTTQELLSRTLKFQYTSSS